MRLTKPKSTLALCVALFFWGCPADEDVEGEMNTSVNTSEEALAQFSQVYTQLCRYMLKCDVQFPSKGLTQADCEAFYNKSLARSDLSISIAGVDEGRVNFNQAGLQCTLDAIAGAVNTCGEPNTLACPALFTGNIAEGERCLIDEECSMGLECSNDSQACESGVCQVAEPTCMTDADCVEEFSVENATCVTSASSPSGVGCDVPDAGEGDNCNILDCEVGLVCVEESDDQDPVCRAPQTLGVGQPCNTRNGRFCADELRCTFDNMSETAFSCQASVQLGEICRAATDSLSFSNCAPGLHCSGVDFESRIFEGVCVTSPVEGEACAEGLSSPLAQIDGEGYCPAGLECINGTCQRFKGYGSPCASDNECSSRVCQGGTCGVDMCAP